MNSQTQIAAAEVAAGAEETAVPMPSPFPPAGSREPANSKEILTASPVAQKLSEEIAAQAAEACCLLEEAKVRELDLASKAERLKSIIQDERRSVQVLIELENLVASPNVVNIAGLVVDLEAELREAARRRIDDPQRFAALVTARRQHRDTVEAAADCLPHVRGIHAAILEERECLQRELGFKPAGICRKTGALECAE